MGAMMMDTMMIDTVNDEMPVMMMTENTMLLSPAVTAPEFRGQLFDAARQDTENILRADRTTVVRDVVSPPSPALLIRGTPSVAAATSAADTAFTAAEPDDSVSGDESSDALDVFPTEPELLPRSEDRSEEPRAEDRSAEHSKAEHTVDDATSRSAPVSPDGRAESTPEVSLRQPGLSLAERITGVEIPSLDELFSRGYRFAVEDAALVGLRDVDEQAGGR